MQKTLFLISIILVQGLIVKPAMAIAPNDVLCLAKNIYFEARGESLAGKIAVGIVTLNRTADPRWPSTICEVVYQPKQFSWTSGKLRAIDNQAAWIDALYVAELSIEIWKTKKAVYYHELGVSPKWKNKVEHLYIIDNHTFYK